MLIVALAFALGKMHVMESVCIVACFFFLLRERDKLLSYMIKH